MPSPPAYTYAQANRRYRFAFWPAMVIYAILCFAGPAMLKAVGNPKWVAAAIAIVTAAPVAFVFWLMGRWLKETDEYTRAKHIDAMLVGGGVLFALSIGWGFLEIFEVAPHLPTFFMAPGFFAAYGVASFVQRLFGSKPADA